MAPDITAAWALIPPATQTLLLDLATCDLPAGWELDVAVLAGIRTTAQPPVGVMFERRSHWWVWRTRSRTGTADTITEAVAAATKMIG